AARGAAFDHAGARTDRHPVPDQGSAAQGCAYPPRHRIVARHRADRRCGHGGDRQAEQFGIADRQPVLWRGRREGGSGGTVRGEKLVAEAGYHGQPIKMITNKRYAYVFDSAVLAQEMARAAGINIELEVLDWAAQLDRYNRGDYQSMSFVYSARLDPSLSF